MIQLFLKFAARKATGAAPCSRYTGGSTVSGAVFCVGSYSSGGGSGGGGGSSGGSGCGGCGGSGGGGGGGGGGRFVNVLCLPFVSSHWRDVLAY